MRLSWVFPLLLACGAARAAPVETVLHSFGAAPDGRNPFGGLALDALGHLYGTTLNGGASGQGTVFVLGKTGAGYTVLHGFSGTDGAAPYAGVTPDADGVLWGTASKGGAFNAGTVFRLFPKTGTLALVWQFTGHLDGGAPLGRLTPTYAGPVYGTASTGGQFGVGTVFRLTASGSAPAVLHHFASGSDGANPMGGLIRDDSGALYGTTFNGGLARSGTAFKVAATGAEQVLHHFAGGADGANPQGGLVWGPDGGLYGTTAMGGAAQAGTVFGMSPAGSVKTIHAFGAGSLPTAGLVADRSGNLYGVVPGGGSAGKGAVFRVSPAGRVTLLYSFTGGADGGYPHGALVIDKAGMLYGTAFAGGDSGNGVVFRLRP